MKYDGGLDASMRQTSCVFEEAGRVAKESG